MMISGHKMRSVIDRYDIVSEGDLREAANKLSGGTTENLRAQFRAQWEKWMKHQSDDTHCNLFNLKGVGGTDP